YSIRWRGQFFAERVGDYYFLPVINDGANIGNNTDVRMDLDGTPQLFGSTYTELVNPFHVNVPNAFHPINLYYRKTGTSTNGGITWLYRAPGDPSFKVLSAEVLSPTAAFVTPTILSGLQSVSVDTQMNQAKSATFQVADITHNPQYTWNSNTQSFNVLKPNRLVYISMGYLTTSTGHEELTRVFTGLIDSVEPDHTREGVNLSVTCRDFTKLCLDSIIENYPNQAGYHLPIQMTDQDKQERLPTYDGWLIRDAIKDLALRCGIDTSHVGATIDRRMAYRLGWTQQAVDIEGKLQTKTFNPVDRNQGESAPYLFQFPYGDKVWDKMQELADLVGFMLYFDEFGHLVFRDARDEYRLEQFESLFQGNIFMEDTSNKVVKESPSLSNTAHSWVSDSRSSNGSYDKVTGDGIIRFFFEGIGCSLFYVKDTTGGTFRWEIREMKNRSIVRNGTINSNAGAVSFQNEEVLTRTLEFNKYELVLYQTANPSATFGIEALNVYRRNVITPLYTFRATQDIVKIGVNQDNENIRNDIIVVGTASSDPRSQPQYGRSVDLNSVTDPTAENYIGHRSVFVLRLRTIGDKQHLQWFADRLLDRYRIRHRLTTFETVGVPHLQLLDPIAIVDAKVGIDTPTLNPTGAYTETSRDVFWVEGIQHSIAKSQFTTQFAASTYIPFRSWRPAFQAPPVKTAPPGTNPGGDPVVPQIPKTMTPEDLTALFSNLTLTIENSDGVTVRTDGNCVVDRATTSPVVKINFDCTTVLRTLYVDIRARGANQSGAPIFYTIFGAAAGQAPGFVGTFEFFWPVSDQSGALAKNGTYELFIYGQIDDNTGRSSVYPTNATLFADGNYLTAAPNTAFVWKPTGGNIPTIDVVTSSAKKVDFYGVSRTGPTGGAPDGIAIEGQPRQYLRTYLGAYKDESSWPMVIRWGSDVTYHTGASQHCDTYERAVGLFETYLQTMHAGSTDPGGNPHHFHQFIPHWGGIVLATAMNRPGKYHAVGRMAYRDSNQKWFSRPVMERSGDLLSSLEQYALTATVRDAINSELNGFVKYIISVPWRGTIENGVARTDKFFFYSLETVTDLGETYGFGIILHEQ
ncbi:hypothetical protein HY496_02645, partial [Candidatus Woesearchaeota archaeon]|nr:hypothetical protein [Candidatus Woesearchaeota archaeon]